MNIHLYLNDENETQIASFYDIQSDPFKIGDEINLNPEEIYPADYNDFIKEVRIKFIKENKEMIELFRLKRVKLISLYRELRFNGFNSQTYTIEYKCEFVDKNKKL